MPIFVNRQMASKKFKMKKIYLILLISLLAVVLGAGFYFNKRSPQKTAVLKTPPPSIILPSPVESIPISASLSSPTPLPSAYMINNVPFQPQAPYGNWDELHDEACEEAAVILVKFWQAGQSTISAQTMDNEILKMVDWQIKNWGMHQDLTVQETAEMAQDFYGLKLVPKYGITIEDIKKEIAQNHLAIVPTAGRLLGNPYYRQPGPVYHMLVVIGYSGSNIIVQDIGTKRGEHYQYNQGVLFNAIHDWPGTAENIEGGKKAMLTVF